MSEITDFYLSWLGNQGFGSSGIRFRDQEPLVFRPTDISGCRIWLDANDNDAVQYDDVLQVISWANKGTLGGKFDLSGGIVLYGQNLQNGLNTVTFDEYGFMTGVFNLDFQNRSLFYVIKPNTLAKPTPIFTSDVSGHQETAFDLSGTWTTFIAEHASPFPEIAFETTTDYTGYAYMTSLVAGTDLSDNWCGYNGTYTAPIYQSPASFTLGSATYFLGNYLGGSPIQANYDMCELILYDGVLSDPQRIEVEKYLRTRWRFTDPPGPEPPTPIPFKPTDISGLAIWFDGDNNLTLTTDLSGEVLSWQNLGYAGETLTPLSNVAKIGTDDNSNTFVRFPQGTSLGITMALPYYSRTQFAVVQFYEELSSFSNYPYVSILNTGTETYIQTGFNYDTFAGKNAFAMCQQGQNCPLTGYFPLSLSNYALAIWANDSNNTSNNLLLYNGGSNINFNTDLGNLFGQGSNSWLMGNANPDGASIIVAEVLEYDSYLSSSNISTVADYLVNKWAISSFVSIV